MCFLGFANKLTVNLHTFFLFKLKSFEEYQLDKNFPSGKIWGPGQKFLFAQKSAFFSTCWPSSPFVFAQNDSIPIFFVFLLNLYHDQRIKFWCNFSWLQNFCKWSPRWWHFFTTFFCHQKVPKLFSKFF